MTLFNARLLPHADAVPALVTYVVALLALPSALIVGPLGSAGTPAQIAAVGLFAWWLVSRVVSRRRQEQTNPIKWLVAIFAIAVLSAYVAAMIRPIAYAIEVNAADRFLLSLCAWCGVVLVLADGITSYAQLSTVLRTVAGGVTLIAVLGMLQFAFSLDIAHFIHIPGLVYNHAFGDLDSRSKFNRVNGTTTHPIEFGVVLSCALPLVIHFARFSETQKQRRRWSIAVAIVLIALPMSVARSAALGGFVAIAVLFFTWSVQGRIRALILTVVGSFAMSVVVPGLLGTIRGLFINASSDPSTQGRTADYGPVFDYFRSHPVFGRGFGTYIPSLYRTLDNAYLGILVECGLFGLLSLLALFIGTAAVAIILRRRSRSAPVRDLAQSLLAGILVVAVNSATFDALGFSMCAGMIFVLVGSTAALWSIESRRWTRSTAARTPVSQTWVRAGVTLLCLALLATAVQVKRARPEFISYGTILVVPPPTAGQPAFVTAPDTAYTAGSAAGHGRPSRSRHASRPRRRRVRGCLAGRQPREGHRPDRRHDVDPVFQDRRQLTAGGDPVDGRRHRRVQNAVGPAAGRGRRHRRSHDSGQHSSARDGRLSGARRRSRAYVGFLLLFTVAFSAFWQVIRRRRMSVDQAPPAPPTHRALIGANRG